MSSYAKLILILLLGAGAVYASSRIVTGLGEPTQAELRTHEVQREDLALGLVERGKLESQSNILVRSPVEDIRGDGIMGNAIIWLAPNGSFVKKGDLLAVLDSGTHVERVDEQILETDEERAAQIEADVLYQNQISKNATLEAAAELNLRLAKLELEMFKDPDKGTYRLQVDEINRMIDDTENQILAAKASLQLSANELEGLTTLFRYGYVGKNELDKVRLDYMEAESNVSANTNRLQTHLATVKKMNVFERKMQLMTLEGAVNSAQRAIDQVKLDNAAKLATAKSRLDRANRVLAKEEELLERYQWHLENCDIRAPADGMVAYAVPSYWREQPIELGATVWEGQRLLYLPDLRRMQVETVVHETARNWVRKGQKATIRVESANQTEYEGTVANVELMPDRGKLEESDTKVYKTLVTINEEVSGLKPGMTALVEIHLDTIKDAITVPVEALIYEDGSIYCHLRRNGVTERVEVKLGRGNGHMVQITDGIAPGDIVVLND